MKCTRQVLRVFSIGLLVGSLGCSATRTYDLGFEPTESLRVMVLPFVELDSNDEIVQPDAEYFVDGIPLVSERLEEDPPELLRQMVQTALEGSAQTVLAPYLVNVELPHHGFGRADGSFNLKKIYSVAPKELCRHFLDCDAVMYGYVTDWDRSYYGIQTVNAVGLRLKILSARTGKQIFSSEIEESSGRGLSGGPTGFSDLVIEPLKGLDSKEITEVARRVAEEAVSPLMVGRSANVKGLPSPPSIYAVAHTVSNDVEGGSRVHVLVFAAPHLRATFSIGEGVVGIPLFEVEPGNYIGEYRALPNEAFSNATVSVVCQDDQGRATEQTSGSGTLSLKG